MKRVETNLESNNVELNSNQRAQIFKDKNY